MRVVDVFILVGWIAFWVYWLAAASGMKEGRTRWVRSIGVRVVLIIVLVLFLHSRSLGHVSHTTSPWLQSVGLAVFLLGLAAAIWARINLGRNWGTPMTEKVDPDLITSGPYGRVRHPIYSGIILAMIGTAIAVSWYWLTLAVFAGAYFTYSAFAEERYMATRFPDEYSRYQQSTKMLIPFIF